MEKWALVCISIFIGGCATPPPPQVIREPYEVEKPIPAPCKFEWPSTPDYKTNALDKTAKDDVWLRAALYERAAMLGYIPKLEARLKGCQ